MINLMHGLKKKDYETFKQEKDHFEPDYDKRIYLNNGISETDC